MPMGSAAQRWKRSSAWRSPASLGPPAWTQAPTDDGRRSPARSSVTPSCHRATAPQSARCSATGSNPTADALNSAGNGAFLPRSQATMARATAIPSTTSGVTKMPLVMAVTSFSRPAVVICSTSSASGMPLSCPVISSVLRIPGAGSQRRANAAPAKDVAAIRASNGQRMRLSWTAVATPAPGSVSVRGMVSAVIGKCPALRRLAALIAPGYRQWRTPLGAGRFRAVAVYLPALTPGGRCSRIHRIPLGRSGEGMVDSSDLALVLSEADDIAQSVSQKPTTAHAVLALFTVDNAGQRLLKERGVDEDRLCLLYTSPSP